MSSAWALIGLVTIAGCTQRHLSIGAIEDDAEDAGPETTPRDADAESATPRLDASMPRDADVRATDAAEASLPLDVKLRVFDREDVALIRAGCRAPCADFRVIPRGGTPPYQITWIDAETASTRTLCPGADLLTLGLSANPVVTVDVTDSTPGDAGRARALTSIFIDECSTADAGAPGWELCLEPTLVDQNACPEENQNGLWFALEEAVDEPNVSVRAVVTGATFTTSVPVELSFTGELCGSAVLPIADATISFANASVQGSASPRGARFVRLRNPDGAAGLLPPGLAVSELRVCLRR